ncbi:hypothetical protein glysoja_044643 [Glycine soja]|uniref:Uncharacterized protein n=1 Tax=Glycine soja TaxID=3848 RepID=A0A0B2QX66_GLYSO|nr:hypothetical protein glysoja_044643 [Glycine soja]
MATLDSDVIVFPAGEASSSGGPSSSTKKLKRFKIKKWNVILSWIILLFVGTISWISVLSVRPTKLAPLARNAL